MAEYVELAVVGWIHFVPLTDSRHTISDGIYCACAPAVMVDEGIIVHALWEMRLHKP